MNVMAQAHAAVKAMFARYADKGITNEFSYREAFAACLRVVWRKVKVQAANVAAKYTVKRFIKIGQYESIDIRDLPVYSAAQGVPENVEHWNINGRVTTDEGTYTELVSGYHKNTLARHLEHWADATRQGYNSLYLMITLNDKAYRLTR
jgi:hypothetical protein